MDKEDGGPAFPRVLQYSRGNDGNPYYQATHSYEGMTLRDWFATHAPTEIPKWFEYVHPTPIPKMPSRYELPDELQKQLDGLDDWLDQSEADPRVIEFRRKVDATQKAQRAWSLEHQAAEFIAWRWHYADMMLAARNQ